MAKSKSNNIRYSQEDFQKEKAESNTVNLKKIDWIKDPKTQKIVGIFLILFSLFLFLSFISYFLEYQNDQDVVMAQTVKEASNMMGYIGAWFSRLFIEKWFGIGAFVLLFSVFTVGTKLTFNWQLYPISKIIRYSFFIILWVCLLLGAVFSKTHLHLGGGIGLFGFEAIKSFIGLGGFIMFMFIYLFAFVTIVYNFDLKLFFNKNKQIVDLDEDESKTEVRFHEHDLESEAILKEYQSQKEEEKNEIVTIIESQNDDDDGIVLISEEEEDNSIKFDIEPSLEANKKTKKVELKNDFELKIETPSEEEIIFETETINNTKEELEIEEVEEKKINLDEPFDPKLDLPGYQFPTADLLTDYDFAKAEIDRSELENSKNLIVNTLKNYNIAISEIRANIGPTVTLYEIVPAPGVKISRIKNLEDDIALSLAALGIRIIAPIPGKGTIGIEVPNKKPEMVPMKQMIASKKFQECNFELPVILGKTISNELYIADLAKMPHLLCAGATGQGKSVGLNTIICSLLYKKHPSMLKFVLVDPKKVELTLYSKIERHFLAKLPGDADAIITDTKLVCNTLQSLCIEMDERYELLKAAGKRNIIEYNQKFVERKLLPTEGHRYLPYIVVVIDEVADLMMTAGREVETPIARLAQLARAIGIHVILATQRPSVNIITGTIKANFPARLAFRVTSKIDSRTILDSNGADQLIGKGDMLFSTGNDLIRLQCPFVDTPEVEKITDFIGNQRGYSSAMLLPEYKSDDDNGSREDFDPNDKDALFEEAARLIVQTQQGSTSLIQRKLKLGYNRAGRLIDQLEQAGIVGPFEGAKARKVLIPDEASLNILLDNL